MATYVIGDIHGCLDPLVELLDKIHFDPSQDQAWFVGDIINRGPESLASLRYIKNMGDAAKMVLGNHDFHLLASYLGVDKYRAKSDTLAPILEAEDVDELIDWLRQQPLILQHNLHPWVMVHAGIPPQWSIAQATAYAQEVHDILRSPQWVEFVRDHLFGSKTRSWHPELSGWDRYRYIVNAFVRLRYCDAEGRLEFKTKSHPKHFEHPNYLPWFAHANRRNKDQQIFFGHWSTLGAMDAYQVHATDTGCLWGGQLTAYCADTRTRYSLDCPSYAAPKHAKSSATG
ncbi:symmetrical bis(5'-nucleosyl)-tetraphosphatase [Thiomicrospira sp. ALE5]|uniref:symmetrical bis(5'-nucleosyl)-tetraphosphatase n=1 Tax=Thiomicrospira sp. ALE5 TaxID=748650 RepID=UPI0008ED315F|nr:symmetrical bis(5'-nucleosyl)-tetraphosphatase [Thiomicrospira sp. ALE5]SFR53286.1 Bis(5'nucleosyl)-tetraphosphatase, ApaH [Thiomicrospira sp. ALE5]